MCLAQVLTGAPVSSKKGGEMRWRLLCTGIIGFSLFQINAVLLGMKGKLSVLFGFVRAHWYVVK